MRRETFQARYGRCAVVVGGSEGLGAAFAEELAARGLDLVLVARRRDALEAEADRLRRTHGVAVTALAVDAAGPGGTDAIERGAQDADVGLLVSSAAFGPIGAFLELTDEQLDRMVELNCRVPARLAHAFGRRLVARGRGGIVLLSSMAGLQGSACIAHYAATKAYERVLAEGLWAELGPHGVDVLACCPGRVRTPTYERTSPAAGGALAPPVMEAGEVARQALDALGREPVVIPGSWNRWSAWAMQRLLPRRTGVALVSAATRVLYPRGRKGSRPSPPPGGPAV